MTQLLQQTGREGKVSVVMTLTRMPDPPGGRSGRGSAVWPLVDVRCEGYGGLLAADEDGDMMLCGWQQAARQCTVRDRR